MFGLNKLNITIKRLNNEVSYLVRRKDELEKEIAERQEKVNKLSYVNTEDISVRIKERDSLIEEVRNIKIEIALLFSISLSISDNSFFLLTTKLLIFIGSPLIFNISLLILSNSLFNSSFFLLKFLSQVIHSVSFCFL